MEVGAVRQVQQELGKDAYLQLFAAQAQNQNPLDPMDSSQFLAEMAQFTSLEQLTNVNLNFEKLLAEVQEMKADNTGGQMDLTELTRAQQVSAHLDELRAAEGMLDRDITFNDPETGEARTEEVKAIVLQNGVVWIETENYALNITDVVRIES